VVDIQVCCRSPTLQKGPDAAGCGHQWLSHAPCPAAWFPALFQKNSLRQDLVEFLVSVDQNLALTVTTSRSAAELKVLAWQGQNGHFGIDKRVMPDYPIYVPTIQVSRFSFKTKIVLPASWLNRSR